MGRTNIGGAGAKINGIIEEYKVASGENISAGDFVEFVNNISSGEDTLLSNFTNSYIILAEKLDYNKIIITFINNKNLYGRICTINNGIITSGEDTLIYQSSDSLSKTSVLIMSSEKIFITVSVSTYTYGILCIIEDKIFKKIVNKYNMLDNYSGNNPISMAKIDENKFVLISGQESGNYLYGSIFEMTESDDVTMRTNVKLNSNYGSGSNNSVCIMDNRTIFISHVIRDGGSSSVYQQKYYLGGAICKINNNSISLITDIIISKITSINNRLLQNIALNNKTVLTLYSRFIFTKLK